MNKPNLLFVYADQMRGSAMGFIEEELVSTPNLDRFAEESLILPDAVSNYPVCVPYRTILMTGKYPISNGVHVNCFCDGRDLPNHHVWWTDILDKNGWFCAYFGKWHITNVIDEYDGQTLTKEQGHWLPPERHHGIRSWMVQTSNNHMAMNYVSHDRGPTEMQKEDGRWTVEIETDKAIAFLENSKGEERDPDKPFSLTISWNPPHDPLNQVPQRYLDMITTDVESLCDHLGYAPEADTEMGSLLRKRIRPYYAAITGIDDQFGRLLSCLDEQGLSDDTIVIFTADHGDQIGLKTCRDPKNMPWEESMRVPFLIRWPGKIESGFNHLLLSTADIYPTILELLGLEHEIAPDLEGVSLAPELLGDFQDLPTSQLYMHIREPEGDPAWGRRGVRTHDYTLCINKAPDEPNSCVLYDNCEDPFQTDNIAASNREVVEELIEHELKPWLERTNDPFEIPPIESFINNQWHGTPPSELNRKIRRNMQND